MSQYPTPILFLSIILSSLVPSNLSPDTRDKKTGDWREKGGMGKGSLSVAYLTWAKRLTATIDAATHWGGGRGESKGSARQGQSKESRMLTEKPSIFEIRMLGYEMDS